MYRVTIQNETSLPEFRDHVRTLIGARIKPRDVTFSTAESADLFGEAPPADGKVPAFTVPGAYVELAQVVLSHRDSARFALLYELLWRLLHEDRKLMSIHSDPLLHKLRHMEKSVRRDLHKMTAFLRFRKVEDDDGELYIAWFEPQHLILGAAAAFFIKRFANMRWSILTPDGTLNWDTNALSYGPAVPKAQAPQDDAMEDWWRSYYASTFNPARVNPEMMRSEMPVRYWKNLPEASLIPGMIAAARARTGAMLDTAPTEPRKNKAGDIVMREFFASDAPQVGLMAGTLAALRAEAASCRRCPLYGHATQTVFGEGPERAPVVFVGEQPGDQEDLGGRPFIGPAGQMFDRALAEAGIARPMVYVTNAVKHFKFVPRGKKRIHQKPNAGEVEHCRWWLERELALIQPKLVVALGATAVKALIGKDVKITEMRGRLLTIRDGLTLVATVHPSYLLRLPDAAAKAAEYGRFVEDLTAVARYLPEIAKAA